MKKTEAIAAFLEAKGHPDLSDLYNPNMEVQINVAPDGGEPIKGEYMGTKWKGWSDGLTTWKSFRIPWNAKHEPNYTDTELKFDLEKHVDAIGMTGWDYNNRRSRYVAFDFDAITGHSDKHAKKLSNIELEELISASKNIPWVTIRRSTSGTGLHLYVFLDSKSNIEVKNHTEHSALARAILGKMSALVGFNFMSKVDVCGSNIWVWARKAKGTNGFELVKQGSFISDDEIPMNWKDHLNVIKGNRRRVRPTQIKESQEDVFEALCNSRNIIKLTSEHRKIIEFLERHEGVWSYDPESNMIVTHVKLLEMAHDELNLKGVFKTLSKGDNLEEQNCFMFPMRDGSWVVRRFTQGVTEHDCWDQDSNGWTRCFLNKEADLRSACRAFGGLEDSKGGFMFQEVEVAAKAALILGTTLQYDPAFAARECVLRAHKDGRLIVEIERKEQDSAHQAPGFLANKSKWTRIININVQRVDEPEVTNYDDMVRHVVSPALADYGWVINSDGDWIQEPLQHVKPLMSSLGFIPREIQVIIGNCISRPWKLTNKPFKPEYPGGREWNRNAAQLRYFPSESKEPKHPTWDAVLAHTGSGLDEAVKHHPWCITAGVTTGGDYLRFWIASMIQYPEEGLPYLFFYNDKEKTGKSIFHEALGMLFTQGCVEANYALLNPQGFNGELEGSVLCYIEEVDLSQNNQAHNRIKDWVTGEYISIHHKGKTVYGSQNTTHWVHCANHHTYCPIFKGDTRITMCFVKEFELGEMIPKLILKDRLIKEAPDFLQTILEVEIPDPDDRLRIPVIDTQEKTIMQEANMNPLQEFLENHCIPMSGHAIKFSDFYDHFIITLKDSHESQYWSKKKVSKMFPPTYPKGRRRKDGQFFIGNLAFKEEAAKLTPIGRIVIDSDGYLSGGEL